MASFLICATTGYFADDVPARCASCGAAIVHRPHADPTHTKICERCAVVMVANGDAPPVIAVTEETRRELALYNTATKGTH